VHGPSISLETHRALARRDPVTAYWLCHADVRQWTVLTLRVTFPGGKVGTQLSVSLPEGRVGCDVAVVDFVYSVDRPNYLLGSPIKEEVDVANEKKPGIDLSLKIQGCGRYLIEDDPCPINIQARASVLPEGTDCCPRITLTPAQGVKGTFTLTRNLAPDENPYRVVLAFRGIALPCRFGGGLCANDVVPYLIGRDLLPEGFAFEETDLRQVKGAILP
jgi:hypothetical protein